ncbi:pyridoxamine 5'-phosphate oxidase [Terrimonas sp. NA20]|uniref:Pyridoxine/pyridoxamine 5'-phosphate oxidase n=1 Tax=Terrimonas ginsenosidimutans TaxID=2908004 RepID=A0ABS9KMZ6_9BACT|nr:pyridoxamine 5'-phosphate oxidase [Terrimonas ginsenosidimutans]MCG2613688.1 pyridoxamine 5'-phosphate oxidase [Terrimonas ginsenosidimutans]
MQPDIAGIRTNYSRQSLSENDIDPNAIRQFAKWWQEAVDSKIEEVNAMTLATASSDGIPSARIVLLKGFSEEGFVFFTNYNSYKGKQLAENPKACLVFFWKELERQVRITGIIRKVSASESDEYFHSRPLGSQIGAIVSPQSSIIESREWLEAKYARMEKEVRQVERPGHWGGYLLSPVLMEFWQGRPSRLHDRFEYSLEENGTWKAERLAP